MHTVGRNGGSAGASARPNGDARCFCIVDKIPHNKVVIYIAHAADNPDFIFQPLLIFLRLIGIALPEAVIAQLSEKFFVGIALRHRISRQMVFMEHKVQVALLGNFHRVVKGFLTAGEQGAQLLLAFEIEVIRGKAHPVFVVHRLSRLDAQQYVLHFGILPAQIVGIVGHHQRKPRLPRQTPDALVHRQLLRDAVILKLQIEISLPHDVRHLQRIGFGGRIGFIHQCLGNGTGQAGRKGNQPIVPLAQQLQVNAGLAVKSVEEGLRHHVAQVLIALAIFAQQHQMIGVVVDAMHPVGHFPPGNIHLAPDDGLDARRLCCLVEINAAIHHAVVGDGNAVLPQFLHPLHHAVNAARTVQETILRVDVQMDKAHMLPSSASSTSRFRRWLMAGFEI